MKKLDEKRQTLLLCVAGALVVLLFPGRWAWESIQSTRDDVATVEAETIELERQARDGEAVANQIDEWNARRAAVEAAVPTQEGFEEVNRMIAETAKATGVVWKTGRPSSSTNARETRTIGGAKVYSFGLSEISGAPLAVEDFLTQLGLMTRIVVIDQVDWREELVNGQPTVQVDLRVGYLAGGARGAATNAKTNLKAPK